MKEKNKKLRLLVTAKCPNKCPLCCNNQFDVDKIPVVDRWNYDEISITGGEPLMQYVCGNTFQLSDSIKKVNKAQGINTKLYIYTASFNCFVLIQAIECFDGIVLTPHKADDIEQFIKFNELLLDMKEEELLPKERSLRLNLFADMKALLPKDIDLSLWKVKDIEWIENCPVPEGEDFRRIANLF